MEKITLETPKTGSDLVLETLRDLGVDTIFGYPGGAVLPLYDAIYNFKGIRHILGRHEQGCLHEAEGYAKSTGKLAVEELTAITGQKAVGTVSKKDEASFKLRKGMPIGAKVTLRADKMYEFLDRLTSSALPRIRDFNGIKADGFDGRGNYNLGITEQIIFPEIVIDKVKKIQGMDITFVTSAKTDKEAKALLTHFGLPFKKN